MKILTSWDDGSTYDYRICKLLKKYNIPGIFYIPTINDLTESEIIAMSKDFVIGGHTTTHPEDMKRLSAIDQYNEIKDNKDYLEQLIGKEINSFCYPGGRYNEITIEQVKKAGFTNARTTMVGHIKEPKNKYRYHTTTHVRPDRKEYKGENWLDYTKNCFKEAFNNNGYLHIFGHGWEIEEFGLWDELEELFYYMAPYLKPTPTSEETLHKLMTEPRNIKVVLS